MQRVLVTGAAGFIGGAMARFCVEQGCSVTGLGHGKPDPFAGLDHWVSGTVSEAVLDRVRERPDIIFHCAGGASVQASVADPAADRARSVTATAALMRWMARAAPEARLVYTSSGAVYGDAAAVPEGRAGTPSPISPYGRHKAEAEQAVQSAAGEHRLHVGIVRLFSVYGPGLRKQLLWDACNKMQTGRAEFFGTGVEKRDFVEIRDVQSLLWKTAGALGDTPLVLDGGWGVGRPVKDVVCTLAKRFEPEPQVTFLGTTRSGDPKDMIADPAGARKLGWKPTIDLEEGLAAYAAWYCGEVSDSALRAV